jgi:nitroreductase
MLNLTPDELLTTTRSVRQRLDFERPVPMRLVRECLEVALQSPSGSNAQGWHFIVVTDTAKRRALGDIYRKGWAIYSQFSRNRPPDQLPATPAELTQARVRTSASYLAEHFHEIPVMVIPCVVGRVEQAAQMPVFAQASTYGSILPAAWSLMLAARARGLASCWTTIHLMFEAEAAQVLGVPIERITQAALIPLAYPKGEVFKPAARKPLDAVLHLDGW